MNCNPVRVLQVQIGGKTFSGVASYLYQYYKHMDHNRVHYDFLFCRENSMALVQDNPVLKQSKFYVLNAVRGKSNDYLAIQRGINHILQKETYDAVVVNTSIVAVIYACMRGMRGIENTKFIAHAHNTELVLGKNSIRAKFIAISKFLDNLMRRKIRKEADYLFACSEDAAEMTFGKGSSKLDKCRLVKNAIDVDAFRRNPSVRESIREQLNTLDNACVYGNVGSFCKRKNQAFLIKVFQIIHSKQPASELWLIGDGADRKMIEELVDQLELKESVKLLGQRNNVNELMQAMDCFVFPTLSEGLGIVAIEAQAAGLPTIVSDGVPKDVLITDFAFMLELEKGEDFWADTILEKENNMMKREFKADSIKDAGYDIRRETENLCAFFEIYCNGKM